MLEALRERQEMVRGAASFIDGLNESVPSVETRVELYQMHEEMKGRNQDSLNQGIPSVPILPLLESLRRDP